MRTRDRGVEQSLQPFFRSEMAATCAAEKATALEGGRGGDHPERISGSLLPRPSPHASAYGCTAPGGIPHALHKHNMS